MKFELGTKGLHKSFQGDFDENCECVHCHKDATIAFVAHELDNVPRSGKSVCQLHDNGGKADGEYWLHDWGAWAIYICRHCAKATCHYNQG